MSEARTDCDRSEGNEVRAVCELSKGGANASPKHEGGLQQRRGKNKRRTNKNQ
jgi:hypothetical protein